MLHLFQNVIPPSENPLETEFVQKTNKLCAKRRIRHVANRLGCAQHVHALATVFVICLVAVKSVLCTFIIYNGHPLGRALIN